ncbi:MAG: Ig-like domain-containing protein, partial [Flavobacteriales bacterium]
MSPKKLLVLVTIIVLATACKKKEVETDNLYKFRDYISYTTSGLTSVADPIIVNLTKDVEGWETDKDVSADILKIEPYVQGKLKANNKHALIFIPDEPLQPDTEYTVTVQLSDIYKNIPKEFNSYTFQFKTITPNFNLVTTNLQSYSKEWQYLEGVIKSADVISLDKAKQLVEAFQDKKKLAIVFNEGNKNSKAFEFKIDSINRKIEDDEILVKWDGSSIKSDTKGENKVSIPGISNFSIINVSVVQIPEQYLSINFSDPLKKQQNFDGLVTLQKVKNPKYIVDG